MANHRKKVSRLSAQADDQLRHMTVNYYGMISLIDHNVGRIETALQDRGLADNTIVIDTSDHGEFLGGHGFYLKGPMTYEGLLRVGLVIKGPGIPKNRVIDDPISTLDLAATFYNWAGIEKPEEAQSKSLKSMIDGNNGAIWDVAYSEWKMLVARCGIDLDLRTVRTKTHKLSIEKNSNDGEMYDLYNDPYEMDNVFDDPAYGNVQRELEDMIQERHGHELKDLPAPVGIYQKFREEICLNAQRHNCAN